VRCGPSDSVEGGKKSLIGLDGHRMGPSRSTADEQHCGREEGAAVRRRDETAQVDRPGGLDPERQTHGSPERSQGRPRRARPAPSAGHPDSRSLTFAQSGKYAAFPILGAVLNHRRSARYAQCPVMGRRKWQWATVESPSCRFWTGDRANAAYLLDHAARYRRGSRCCSVIAGPWCRPRTTHRGSRAVRRLTIMAVEERCAIVTTTLLQIPDIRSIRGVASQLRRVGGGSLLWIGVRA